MKRIKKSFGCPVELSLEIVGGKWKPVILARLKDRAHRYSELRRLIPSLSDKMLTQRLKELEGQGLIARGPDTHDDRQDAYRLTTRGESLRPVLQALYNWGTTAAEELHLTIRDPTITR